MNTTKSGELSKTAGLYQSRYPVIILYYSFARTYVRGNWEMCSETSLHYILQPTAVLSNIYFFLNYLNDKMSYESRLNYTKP